MFKVTHLVAAAIGKKAEKKKEKMKNKMRKSIRRVIRGILWTCFVFSAGIFIGGTQACDHGLADRR